MTLSVALTEQELLETARSLATDNNEIAKLESRRKAFNDQLKAEISRIQQRIAESTEMIFTQAARREMEVDVYMNQPEPGKKTVVCSKIGEKLVMQMTDEDRQLTIEDYEGEGDAA